MIQEDSAGRAATRAAAHARRLGGARPPPPCLHVLGGWPAGLGWAGRSLLAGAQGAQVRHLGAQALHLALRALRLALRLGHRLRGREGW